jgi:transcriptional regulator with XRE-family HTH domain
MTQDPHRRQEDGGVGPGDLKGGGLKLPGLKRWRASRGLSQSELSERVDVPLDYVQRIEQGRRGCNPWVARKMADALEVDLQELRAGSDERGADAHEASPSSGGEPPPRLTSPRFLHKAYVKLLLKREVGSAYVVLDERQFESLIKLLSVEEVVEVISKRRRELEFVEGLLASDDELHPQVHLFLEELVRERPGEDIRVLAARRTREPSEEGRQRLTQAMRGLL